MSNSVEAGKVVLTGAGGGIGLGLAQEFARRGFNVVALLRDATKRAELDKAPAGLEDRVEVQQLDVRNAAGYQMPQDVSILVNNAGIRYEYLPVEEIPMAEWREYFEVHVLPGAIPRHEGCDGGTHRDAAKRIGAVQYPSQGDISRAGSDIPFGGRHSPSYARCSQSPALRAYGGASEGKPEVGQSHILDPDGAMRDGTCAMSRQGLENWLPGRGGEPLIAGVVQSMLDGPR
jgi:NAD(P)-dependent dehydrogenase (short-subunit alcohol dehydrogenase family)